MPATKQHYYRNNKLDNKDPQPQLMYIHVTFRIFCVSVNTINPQQNFNLAKTIQFCLPQVQSQILGVKLHSSVC